MLNRRYFLKLIAFSTGPFVFSLGKAMAQSSEDELKWEFRWRVPQAHFNTVRRELQFDGKIVEEETKGIFVSIFVGTVLLTYLAKAILALRREIVHGGVVIDTRGDKIIIQTDKSLPGGVIVIVTPEGTQYHERDELGNLAELVSKLKRGL